MTKSKAKSTNERQKSFDDRQRALGRVGRKVWATPEEHDQIKVILDKFRSFRGDDQGA